MADFFRQTSPIKKLEFIKTYEEVVLLTQVFIAPLGLCSSTIDILGNEIAIDEYAGIFRQWEEFLSKYVFLSNGFTEGMSKCFNHYLKTW